MYEGKVDVLVAESYSRGVAEHALDLFGGEIDVARAWISDPANEREIIRLQAEEFGIPMEEAMSVAEPDATDFAQHSPLGSPVSREVSLQGTFKEDLILLNPLGAPEGSLLARTADLMTRIEDLSHLLVWAKMEDLDSASMDIERESHAVCLIELPRLKITFQPRLDADGTLRLYLTDHAGWFVSDRYTITDSSAMEEEGGNSFAKKQLEVLLKGMENSLVLENNSREVQVLVANHDVYRPKIQGEPFTTQLVFDRGSLGWQQAVDMRYYLYPVHTSFSFLIRPTLSSTLYMVLLRLLNREYVTAFRIADTCSVDVPFAAEENWIWAQFERTIEDLHPDAQATRLKLALAVQYSRTTNKCKWENHVELDGYLKKLPHISAACRLSYKEEFDVLHLASQATPLIKNRLNYLKAANEGKQDVVLTSEAPRWGGQPWLKLTLQSLDYLAAHGTVITRIHFKKPQSLNNEECLNLIWSNTLIMDEESGANRQLGFVFLYELLRGRQSVTINGENIGKDLGEILTRYFHLKLSRWGKEQVDEGEVESSNSRQMAQLAAVIAHPDLAWPVVPVDSPSVRLMERGINLFSKEGRMSNVKTWIDLLDMEFVSCMGGPLHKAKLAATHSVLDNLRANPIKHDYDIHVDREDVLRVKEDETQSKGPASDRAEFPQASDTSCGSLTIHADATLVFGVSPSDLATFGKIPLAVISLDRYIVWKPYKEDVPGSLPFDIASHPAARTVIAKELLARLEQDVAGYAKTLRETHVPYLIHLTPDDLERYKQEPSAENLRSIFSLLDGLVKDLNTLQEEDGAFVGTAIDKVLNAVNLVTDSANGQSAASCTFWLRRYAAERNDITLELLTQALLSSQAIRDVLSLNPYAQRVPEILNLVATVLLHVNRISHTNRAISLARDLISALSELQRSQSKVSELTIDKILQASQALNDTLTAGRYYATAAEGGAIVVDPRFLVFEYVFDLQLRNRQVEMVNWFVDNLNKGNSRVQQMIMGAGKTTVVGPLLTLILADGKQLVTQVMPTALLDQTRSIMRNRFSSIITKRVYTLQFERSCEDDIEFVGEIFAKLDGARRSRSVICASPEAIKSLMLKFIEQLHSIEQLDLDQLVPGTSIRQNKEIAKLRDTMLNRSDMADAVVRILELWKSGVLICDEVDLLLHPLRSELNFPIGHKDPIDLAGYRWDLPIHLIDGIFYSQTGKISETLNPHVSERLGYTAESVLKDLSDTVNEGYEKHSLQRNPHMVLLDYSFYETRLLPLLAKWSLLWLWDKFTGNVDVGTDVLLAYISGQVETYRERIEKGVSKESKKLLNLAGDWVRTLMPHCLSKIDRVSYGILNPEDLKMIDPRAPLSRKLMAVPFVGKDVPSRSSEFAHPVSCFHEN